MEYVDGHIKSTTFKSCVGDFVGAVGVVAILPKCMDSLGNSSRPRAHAVTHAVSSGNKELSSVRCNLDLWSREAVVPDRDERHGIFRDCSRNASSFSFGATGGPSLYAASYHKGNSSLNAFGSSGNTSADRCLYCHERTSINNLNINNRFFKTPCSSQFGAYFKTKYELNRTIHDYNAHFYVP